MTSLPDTSQLRSIHRQLPFTTQRSSGQTVTPAYEGWYRNADGSFTLSFGYYNRNASESVEIPAGLRLSLSLTSGAGNSALAVYGTYDVYNGGSGAVKAGTTGTEIDTLKIYLSNTAPDVAADDVKADLTEITNENG